MAVSEAHLIDCMEFMSKYPDGYFELAFPDVQYGIGESRKVQSRTRPDGVLQKNGSRLRVQQPVHVVKTWDDEQPPQEYFDELFRVSRKQIIFGENYLQFDQKGQSSGRIFWDKVTGNSHFSDGEMLWTNLFSSVRQITYMWAGFCQGISLDIPTIQRGNKKTNEKRIHPSQKPVLLYKALLKWAQPGWKILDTHMGSGSSRIAAHELGFDYYGCERETDYFALAGERFEGYLHQPRQEALFAA